MRVCVCVWIGFNLGVKGSRVATIWIISRSSDCNHGNLQYILGYFSVLSQGKQLGSQSVARTTNSRKQDIRRCPLMCNKSRGRSRHDWFLRPVFRDATCQITISTSNLEQIDIWFVLQLCLLAPLGSE